MIARPISFHTSGNVSIVQLATGEQDSFEYISASAAMKKNLVEVKEVSQTADVNTLVVLNSSDQFVFLMDGDILAGAKQNRVVNTSIMLAPKSKTLIPVSCVEQGRWRHVSPKFSGTPYTASHKLRADKARNVRQSLKEEKGFDADQGQVWQFAHESQVLFQMASPTSNLSDIYDKKEKDFDTFAAAFQANPESNGLAVFIAGTMKDIDIFNRRDVYQEYFPKILRGTAFEAFLEAKAKKGVEQKEAEYRTLDFLDRLMDKRSDWDRHPGVGVGTDMRFELDKLAGFELSYNERMIHLTALNAE